MLHHLERFVEKDHEKFPMLAVILFTAAQAHIFRALQTREFIDALDEVTGNSIGVYYAALPNGQHRMPSMPGGMCGYMIPVWHEPNSNKKLLEAFGIKDSQELPKLALFSFGRDGRLVFALEDLGDLSADAAFNDLREILSEKASLIRDFDNELLCDKEKMLTELGVFQSARQIGVSLKRFLQAIRVLRGVAGV